MLKKLHIQNFQSHKDTIVEFSENVTCFVGLNNHGKSSILKALWKVIRDEPDGAVFITRIPKQETQCNIILETDKGIVERIVKLSGAGNNMYIVNDIPFSNFGKTGIPLEVHEILDISQPMEFGDLTIDLNFQNQLDTLFLVQGAGLPSIRGKVLGKVTNVDDAQRAIQLGASEEKQLKQELGRIQKEIDGVLLDLEIYKDLPQQESFLDSISLQFERIDNVVKRKNVIEVKRDELKDIVSSAKKSQEVVNKTSYDFKDSVESILQISRKISLLKDLIAIQSSLFFYRNIVNIQLPAFAYNQVLHKTTSLIVLRSLSSLQSQLHLLQKRANVHVTVDLIYMNSLQSKVLSCNQVKSNIDQIYTNLVFYRQQEESSVVEQNNINKEFESLKKELKICPTCERAF